MCGSSPCGFSCFEDSWEEVTTESALTVSLTKFNDFACDLDASGHSHLVAEATALVTAAKRVKQFMRNNRHTAKTKDNARLAPVPTELRGALAIAAQIARATY